MVIEPWTAGVRIKDRRLCFSSVHLRSLFTHPTHRSVPERFRGMDVFPRITLAPACMPVNSGKTAIFLTLCDDLLWFFRQTLP